MTSSPTASYVSRAVSYQRQGRARVALPGCCVFESDLVGYNPVGACGMVTLPRHVARVTV